MKSVLRWTLKVHRHYFYIVRLNDRVDQRARDRGRCDERDEAVHVLASESHEGFSCLRLKKSLSLGETWTCISILFVAT